MALSGVFGNVFGDGDHAPVGTVTEGTVYNNGGLVGTNTQGPADYPDIADVRLGVEYDTGDLVGTLDVDAEANLPPVGKVINDTTFGTTNQFAGVYVPTAVESVILNTLFGANSAESGVYHVPAPNDVRDGSLYGPNDNTPGTLAVPNPANVLRDVATDDTVGTYWTLIAANVRDAIQFGANGGLLGTLVSPAASDVRLSVPYGAAGEFLGTVREAVTTETRLGYAYGASDSVIGELNVSTAANSPAPEEVLDGIAYGESLELTGVYVEPPQAGVAIEVSYGPSSSLTGLLTTPDQIDVRLNVQYGPNLSLTGSLDPAGSPDYPAPQDVRDGTIYSEGASTGRLVVPDVADVRLDTLYDTPIPGVEKTGTLDLPDISDVRLSTSFDGGAKVGNVKLPVESVVLLGYQYDSLSTRTGTLDPGAGASDGVFPDEINVRFGTPAYGDAELLQYSGRYYPASEADVRLGTEYGGDNVEYVGTFDGGTGTPSDTGWIG